jgi:FkbM family methyltransferase
VRIDIGKVVARTPAPLRRHKFVQTLLWLAPESRIQPFTFNATARAYGDLSDPFIRQYFLSGSFEPEFFDIAGAFLPPGGTFLDVGANIGLCTFGLLSRYGARDLRCEMFEANANLCSLIVRSMRLYPSARLSVHHAAVTDHQGQSRLSVPGDNIGGSFLADDGTVTALNIVLDQYLDRHRIDVVDLMKLDVEGSEGAALRGMECHLRAGVCRAIYTEVSTANLGRYRERAADLLDFLRACDFSLYFCKQVDLKTSPSSEVMRYDTPHGHVDLVPVTAIDEPIHTDVLAIHRTAVF